MSQCPLLTDRNSHPSCYISGRAGYLPLASSSMTAGMFPCPLLAVGALFTGPTLPDKDTVCPSQSPLALNTLHT